jgi:hypothetical protein
MGLIGSIPYIYLDPFGSVNVLDRFTNGFFESVSGYTLPICNDNQIERAISSFGIKKHGDPVQKSETEKETGDTKNRNFVRFVWWNKSAVLKFGFFN